jgi:hypothetical protein
MTQCLYSKTGQVQKSVVREICTLRSVGTGGGRPPPVTRSKAEWLSYSTVTLRFRSERRGAHQRVFCCQPPCVAVGGFGQPWIGTRAGLVVKLSRRAPCSAGLPTSSESRDVFENPELAKLAAAVTLGKRDADRRPRLRGCNPIGVVLGRLQKIGESMGFSEKFQAISFPNAYPELEYDSSICRNQTKIHHHFSESQLDYILLRRGRLCTSNPT